MKLEIHVHVHNDESRILARIAQMERLIMTTIAEVNAKVAELINDATNVIAGQVARVQTGVDALQQLVAELKAQIAAGTPVTQEQLDALDAALQNLKGAQDTIKGNLENLGADAETPVPDPTPLP